MALNGLLGGSGVLLILRPHYLGSVQYGFAKVEPTIKGWNSMTVVTGMQIQIGNLDAFLAGWDAQADRLANYGATSSRVVQVMMGGEMAGRFNVANTWNDIDAAMTGCANNLADPETQKALQGIDAQMLGRTLSSVEHSVGDTSGQFGSFLTGTGDIPSEDDFAELVGRAWDIIGGACTGQMWTRRMAGPNGIGDWAVATYTDSLNDLMAASATLFSNPDQLALLAKTNSQLVGRLMFRKVA